MSTKVKCRNTYVAGSHEPIIEFTIWHAVQAELAHRSGKGTSCANPFANKIKRADCGGYTGTTPPREQDEPLCPGGRCLETAVGSVRSFPSIAFLGHYPGEVTYSVTHPEEPTWCLMSI